MMPPRQIGSVQPGILQSNCVPWVFPQCPDNKAKYRHAAGRAGIIFWRGNVHMMAPNVFHFEGSVTYGSEQGATGQAFDTAALVDQLMGYVYG